MNMPSKRGFVLLAVLWVMVGVSAVGFGLALLARRAAGTTHNRRAAAVATWLAEDCANRVEAAIGDALTHRAQDSARTTEVTLRSWSRLDQAVASSPFMGGAPCGVTMRPTGTTIDVNTADDSLLIRLFLALGNAPDQADSLAAAILDWRDGDDVARPGGAEASWYLARGLVPPRNADLADIRELVRIRGFDQRTGLDSVLGVEPDRIVLDRAPLAVIAALPGFTNEAVARVADHRNRGVPITDLLSLSAELSPAARAAMLADYPDLVRLTTAEPDAWLLTARGTAGTPPVTVVLEFRLVRAGDRAAIVRRRTWVQ
ncbi:MAG: general secretion pathway protein GspK [Gemmatimonadaceae bacterium]